MNFPPEESDTSYMGSIEYWSLCWTCGKELQSSRRKYCSNACRQKAYRQRQKMAKRPFWAIEEKDAEFDPVIRAFAVWRELPWYKRLWQRITGGPKEDQ